MSGERGVILADRPSFGYNGRMIKMLELAFSKAASLPEATQEQLGRELLERIDALTALRAQIEIAVRQMDAGMGEELDIEEFIKQARVEDDAT